MLNTAFIVGFHVSNNEVGRCISDFFIATSQKGNPSSRFYEEYYFSDFLSMDSAVACVFLSCVFPCGGDGPSVPKEHKESSQFDCCHIYLNWMG